jgi:hypothetical protein
MKVFLESLRVKTLLMCIAALIFALVCISNDVSAFTSTPFGMARPTIVNTSSKQQTATTPLTMTGAGDEVNPSTFREAEVLGLKLMQDRKYGEALKGKLLIMLIARSLLTDANPRLFFFL